MWLIALKYYEIEFLFHSLNGDKITFYFSAALIAPFTW